MWKNDNLIFNHSDVIDDFRNSCNNLEPYEIVDRYLIEKPSYFFEHIRDGGEYEFKKEIAQHITSTLHFQIKYKGGKELLKTLFSRFKDFKNMGRWFFKDTSKMRNNLEDKKML